MTRVALRSLGRIEILTDGARRRRAAFHLRDHRDRRPPEPGRERRRAGRLRRFPLHRGAAPMQRRQAVAGRAQDLVEGDGHLVLRPVFGYCCSGSIRSHRRRGGIRAADQATERNPDVPADPHPGSRLRAELRGDRGAIRLPVARHGARAPDEPRAEGVHPPLVQREPLHRGAPSPRHVARHGGPAAGQGRGRHAHRVADASGDHRGPRPDAPASRAPTTRSGSRAPP